MTQSCFGSWRESISLIVPIQEADPVHGERDHGEIFFHLSLQEIGPHPAQHVAEAVVCFGEEDGFVKRRGVFEGDELHGVAFPGVHRLSRDHPSYHGDMLPHMPVEIFCLHMVQAAQNVPVAVEGVY